MKAVMALSLFAFVGFTYADGAASMCVAEKEPTDQVLREVAEVEEEAVRIVVAGDEATQSEDVMAASESRRETVSDDVWRAAYAQWAAEGKNGKASGEVNGEVARVGAVMKRMQELLIASADADAEGKERRAAMQEIERGLEEVGELCYSGDNGRQVADVHGVDTLLKLVSQPDVSRLAAATLATCAQNNPSVFDAAVAGDGVSLLLRLVQNANADAESRATALRALVAISDAEAAHVILEEEKSAVVEVVQLVFEAGAGGANENRGIRRAVALAEKCLRKDAIVWGTVFRDAGAVDRFRAAVKWADTDIREGAARVLKLMDA